MADHEPDLSFSTSGFLEALFTNPKENSILLIDAQGTIMKVNRAFLLAFGYNREDLIGQHFAMLFSEEDQKRDKPARELGAVLVEGQSYDNNYIVHKNKNLTWVSGESVLLKDKEGEKFLLKVIQNIHIQKESELSIVRLNNFNESILGSIEDVVVVLNTELKILKANRSFNKFFNLNDDQATEIDFVRLLMSFDKNAALLDIIKRTIQSDKGVLKTHLEIEGGSGTNTFDISCCKLDIHDPQSNILLLFHDITPQRQLEKQREDILNFVAHELRNPLTSVLLSLEIIEDMLKEKDLGEFDEHIARGKNNAQRINRLIKELYNSTKISSGNYDLEWSQFDFDKMIAESAQAIGQIHPDYKIGIHGAAGIPVFGDRNKLTQVIVNYLTNAIKYSPGNIDIGIGIEKTSETITVSVKDQGTGIPTRDLPFIFNRFFRAEKTRNLEGLGLGLFLCRQIINSHHGLTWAESEEGKGSTFYFSLPLRQPID
jgi:PAS domain S-box-containing protein